MPQMPEPIDLRKSRQSNQLKALTGAVMSELEMLSLGDRANVMMYSLTESQHKEVDEYFSWKDDFDKRVAKPKATYERYITTPRYDIQKAVLSYKGISITFVNSPVARSVLEVLFNTPGAVSNQLPIIDFLDEYRAELNALDIFSAEQLRQAKRNINAKMGRMKLFPVVGTMEIVSAI